METSSQLINPVKVSVLIPCYNCAETVTESLQSIFSQNYTNFEVIAVDDGSTDDTLAILQNLAKLDSRLKVINISHGGIIEALNRGICECQGDFIARMDADDYSAPDRFLKQVCFLETNKEIDVVSCLVEHSEKDELLDGFKAYYAWINRLVIPEAIQKEMFVESPLIHPSVMMRKEALLAVGGYQENQWAEDYDLWLRMMVNGGKFAKVEEVLFQWRNLPTRLTKTDERYSRRNFIKAKAHYMKKSILKDRDAVFVWGVGTTGRLLSNALIAEKTPIKAFFDVDPKRIGKTRHRCPILSHHFIEEEWQKYSNPILLQAVSSRGAREQIGVFLSQIGLTEGFDWYSTA